LRFITTGLPQQPGSPCLGMGTHFDSALVPHCALLTKGIKYDPSVTSTAGFHEETKTKEGIMLFCID